MAPIDNPSGVEQRGDSYVPTRSHLGENGQILEAWAEGWNVGALTILVLIVFCNYRRRNTLHKLILVEVIARHTRELYTLRLINESVDLGFGAWNLHIRARE